MPIESLLKFQNPLNRQRSNSNDIKDSTISNPNMNFIPNTRSADVKIIDKFVDLKVYRFGITVISVLYTLLLTINFILNPELAQLKESLSASYDRVLSVQDKEEYLVEIHKKTNTYKSLTPSSSSFNENVGSITKTGDLGISIKQYTVSRDKFQVFAIGDSPRAFAGLIGMYLSNKDIESIVLESASYNSSDSSISVSMRGKFK